MSVLVQAFEHSSADKSVKSMLGTIFSLPALIKTYSDEKPAVPLKLNGSNIEKRRLTHLINTLAQSSLGKELLENAAKEGYTLGFEYMPDAYGYCARDDKTKHIALNPLCGDSSLITTLAHESRHAMQYSRGLPFEFLQYNIATEAKMWRAAEADAEASAAFCALELRALTGKAAAWNKFSEKTPKTKKAIKKILSGSESVRQLRAKQDVIMQTAFKSWFENTPIVDLYEKGYLYSQLSRMTRKSEKDRAEDYKKYPMNKALTSAQIVQKYCRTAEGACYFENDPNILDTQQEMSGITDDTRRIADKFFQLRQKETGQAPDTSYENLPSRFRLSGLSLSEYQRNGSLSLSQTAAMQIMRHRLRDRG